MMTPQERYQRDPLFRQLVDWLESMITTANMSGTEIREAAMLALIHYEATRLPEPLFLDSISGARVPCPECGELVRHHRSCSVIRPG